MITNYLHLYAGKNGNGRCVTKEYRPESRTPELRANENKKKVTVYLFQFVQYHMVYIMRMPELHMIFSTLI
jgi:hypothetical protein